MRSGPAGRLSPSASSVSSPRCIPRLAAHCTATTMRSKRGAKPRAASGCGPHGRLP
ncbi:hypothetical protein ACFPRL_10920 [Pseudoclavibacter helvolus]